MTEDYNKILTSLKELNLCYEKELENLRNSARYMKQVENVGTLRIVRGT